MTKDELEALIARKPIAIIAPSLELLVTVVESHNSMARSYCGPPEVRVRPEQREGESSNDFNRRYGRELNRQFARLEKSAAQVSAMARRLGYGVEVGSDWVITVIR